MTEFALTRLRKSNHGTFGVFAGPGFWCFSLELPWRDNECNYSCIPPGSYDVSCSWSNAFKRRLYLVEGVPDRSGVRIHPGNWAGDTRLGLRTHSLGCILLGTKVGEFKGQKALILSEPKVSLLQRTLREQPFRLHIIDF